MKHSRPENLGITILELMIVILIISILAVGAMQVYRQHNQTANLVRTQLDMEEIGKAIKRYAIRAGHYPDSLDQIRGEYAIPRSPYGPEYQLDQTNYEIVLNYEESGSTHTLRHRYKPEE